MFSGLPIIVKLRFWANTVSVLSSRWTLNRGKMLTCLLFYVAITIANKNLEQNCMLHETIRIKSGAWDDMGIFIYSTLNHIKYALPQG